MEQFAGVLFTIVSFLVALSVVVFVHEWGHLWIARRNGVRCESFSIGFGHEIWGWTDRLGTRWKIGWLPLGGYVKMFGEAETMAMVEGAAAENGDAGKPRPLTAEERAVSFKYKTAGQRAAIVFAGPAVNIVFAVVVFWLLMWGVGRSVTDPVIGEVLADTAAAEAGFEAGDRILQIDGEEVLRFEDIQRIIALGHGDPITFSVDRGGRRLELSATPRIIEDKDVFGNVQKRALLGIRGSPEAHRREHGGPIQALVWAVDECYDVMAGTVVAVGQMLRGSRGTEDLGGPIRIAKYSGQAAKSGPFNFVIFVAILSLNLGMINLLPVPLLDGGHLLFYAIEAVRDRPLSETIQEWGLRVGLALVLALMVFVTWNDIVQF